MKIATICKRRWRKRSFGCWTKKNLWNSVHNEQSYRRSCWPTLSRQCAFGVCQCIWVWATWLWCRGNFPPSNFPQSDLGRRADSRWALPQISSFFQVLCLFRHIFCAICFSYIVQKRTLGEVGNWTVIWWQVMSGMFVRKINKIWKLVFKLQSKMLGCFFGDIVYVL